ncbi:MAG: outer-membrane lipoprotein carrier protein LolA [Kofleriaceae bacterium]
MDLIGVLIKLFLGFAPSVTSPSVAVQAAPITKATPTKPARPSAGPTPTTGGAAKPPTPAPQVAAAPGAKSAAQVVDEVQKFYASINQVTAVFRQSVTNNTFASTKDSDGTLYIQKPGKMRWDYIQKKNGKVSYKKSFISNGSYLYVVEHDNMQVVQKNLQQDLMPVAISFLYGKGDLKTEFTPELDTSGAYGTKGEIVLKLTPKKPSAQYKNLFLVVSPTDFHVTQSVIVDSANNKNHFRFFAPDFKKPINASTFQFDPNSPAVKNYRKVNANQPPPQGSGAAPAGPAPSTPSKP